MHATSHAYAKASLISGIFSFAVSHQPELQALATVIAIIAGIVSIIKAILEKKK